MTIAVTLPILKARLETCPSIATVLDYVTETDPAASDLPLICMKVNAALVQNEDGTQGGTLDRRALIWPIDLYVFGCVRSTNISADLALVIPLWEEIVGVIDSDLTLGNTLDGVVTYPSPMGGDPGAIKWVDATYTGFVLHPMLRILTETPFS